MAEKSLPWAGTTTGDAGDYTDSEWQELQRYTLGFGAGLNSRSGVFFGSDTSDPARRGLDVEATSPNTASVNVRPGSALVNGSAYINTSTVNLAIAANASGNPRIDYVILKQDVAAQTVRAVIKQGTPGVTPSPPGLTQSGGIFEIPIAEVSVANGFVTLAQSTIQPVATVRNGTNGVYLYGILNNSGGTLKTGDVVVWDTSTDRAVTTTGAARNRLRAGVWIGTTANNNYGIVQCSGVGVVRTNGAVARGDILTTASTAKQAAVFNAKQAFAVALETTSGAGLAVCFIDAGLPEFPYSAVSQVSIADNGPAPVPASSYTTILSTGSIQFYGTPIAITWGLKHRDAGIASTAQETFEVDLQMDGVSIGTNELFTNIAEDGHNIIWRWMSGVWYEQPLAGNHTFNLRVRVSAGTAEIQNAYLGAVELGGRGQ